MVWIRLNMLAVIPLMLAAITMPVKGASGENPGGHLLQVTGTAALCDCAEEPQAGPAASSKEARQRLKEIWALKRTSFKKEASVKRKILLETAQAYEEFCIRFLEASAECAEACFRAGEIYRTLKMTGQAEAMFDVTLTHDAKGVFAARALKELGHIRRRSKDYEKAIRLYERVLAECPAVKAQCADAMTWIGKVHMKTKSYEKARSVFLAFPERYPDFLEESVRNIDLAVQTLILEKNHAAAATLLETWRGRFEAMLGKDARTDRRIEGALEKMKSPEKLGENTNEPTPEKPEKTEKSQG